jgi:hypothetical protein
LGLAAMVLGLAVWCIVGWARLRNVNAEVERGRGDIERAYRLSREYEEATSPGARSASKVDASFNMTNYMDSVMSRAGRGKEFDCKTSHRRQVREKQELVEQISNYVFQNLTSEELISLLWLIEADNDPHVSIRFLNFAAQATQPNPQSTIYRYRLTIELSHFTPLETR